MIGAIFIHFQTILSKSSLTVGTFSRVLSIPFFKSKISSDYPKILIVVSLTNI